MTSHAEMIAFYWGKDREAGFADGHYNLWQALDQMRMWMQWQEKASTDGPPTTGSDMRASLSDAAAPASTDQPTRQSWQSAPPGIPVGLVAHVSGCAQENLITGGMYKANRGSFESQLRMECIRCGASTWFDLTPVPAVAPTPSTSQRPASTPSVQAKTSAESASPAPSEHCMLCNVTKASHPYEFPIQHDFIPRDMVVTSIRTIDTAADEVTR